MLGIAQKQKDLALKAERKPDQRIGGLFPIICQKEWVMQAMWNVLHNHGAETAGVDGIIKATYHDAKTRSLTAKAIRRVEEICQSLKDGDYHPQAVRRIYIPKANGKMRPIGISTLDDRTVQEAIRMVMDPIYESDFLNCSYGFRPNRCTMDAISVCYRLINSDKKYYWIIEGDIRACFDSVEHRILMKLIRNRIADRKLTDTIYKFLKAGYQEEGKITKPDVGVPQGGNISPLLTNAYLHELDKWWSENFDLNKSGKTARRKAYLGNFILARYCDDLIILSNGTKQATEGMKEEVAMFLQDELRLELSQEKTAITHVSDGFEFLGFQIRKFKGKKGVTVKPTKSNVQKLKDKITWHLHRSRHECAVVDIIRSLNPVIRGWTNYYRFVNSYKTFHDLDLYVRRRFLKWYRGKYQLPRKKGAIEGLKWIDKNEPIHLCQFTETKVKRYRWERKPNPYIEMSAKKATDSPIPLVTWYGDSKRNADLRLQCLQRDRGECQICRRPKTNLEAHHIIPLSEGGEDTLDNLITVCEDCHRRYSWQEIKRSMESCVLGNVARTVRRRGG